MRFRSTALAGTDDAAAASGHRTSGFAGYQTEGGHASSQRIRGGRLGRLQMLGAAALIGDPDVRRLVEALTAIEPPSQNALAALVDRLTVLRYERPKPLG